MFGSILILLFIPWLDTSRVRSARYRPVFKWFLILYFFSVIALGYLGAKPPEGAYVVWARIFTFYYYAFFLLVMPIVGVLETPKAIPRSITEAVLGKGSAGALAGAASAPEKR
jgi:ubiquinol-cytochrome c reductase cytochrome b subunit